jgi:hypothetical protein
MVNPIMGLKKEPKNITGCLLNATEAGDQQLVKTILKPFVNSVGGTNYLSLARIPTGERIPALAKADREYVQKILVGQIEYMMKFFNVKNGLSVEQIFLLVDEIIEESEVDNISLQDVYLFCYKLVTGKMGTVYDRVDIPTFMEKFQIHRDERIKQVEEFRYEEQCNHKAMGDTERTSDNQDREKELNRDAIGDYLRAK